MTTKKRTLYSIWLRYNIAEIRSNVTYINNIVANIQAKQASKLFRDLGYSAYDQGNINQSVVFFTKAIQCSKYFSANYDIDVAKNLQGLALIHSEKG